MELNKIKDIIIARWAFIASNAESIAILAREQGDNERLDEDAIRQVYDCTKDIDVNRGSLQKIFNALKTERDEIHD